MKRYIAVQIGARRGYAVPSILERLGLLEAFYTDLCADVGFGGLLSRYCPTPLMHGQIKNLAGRRLPANLKHKSHTFPLPVMRYLMRRRLAGRDAERSGRAFGRFQFELGDSMIKRGVGRATHLFTMLGEGTPFLRFAKSRGLTTVTEVFIKLSAPHVVASERRRLPDIEPAPPAEGLKDAFAWVQDVCDLSDWIIAPSEAVRDDLVSNFKVSPGRCFIVPYAVDDSWHEIKNRPTEGRLLFVGTADLRKGIHILGEAAGRLGGGRYDFRIAGGASESVKSHPLARGLNFLGRVPRSEIKREYSLADVFVLPTLAEGSAEVVYEALAAGVPVVTTAAAGSVVRDGVEGFIVPERDASTLAARIRELVENRELRDRMAAAAKKRARDYRWGNYEERLSQVLCSV